MLSLPSPVRPICAQGRRHFLSLTRVLRGRASLSHLHNTLSPPLPPPPLWGEGTMAENGQCMRLHSITWAGNAGQTPVSPPHAALTRPFHLTLTPFPEPLTHRLYSLRENKLRLKEKNYSLPDKRASSTHSAKNKTDGPPPLSPSEEKSREEDSP